MVKKYFLHFQGNAANTLQVHIYTNH